MTTGDGHAGVASGRKVDCWIRTQILLFDVGHRARIRCEGFLCGQQFDALLFGLGVQNSVEGVATENSGLVVVVFLCQTANQSMAGCNTDSNHPSSRAARVAHQRG